MPITTDVEVTDDITVNFGKSRENVNFMVNIANTGKRSAVVKKIHSSLNFVTVLNFDESNCIIKAGNQMQYLFEAAHEQSELNDRIEGKLRFTFKDHTHITRSIIVYRTDKENIAINEHTEHVKKVNSPDLRKEVSALTPGVINLQGFIKQDYDDWLKDSNGIIPISVNVSDDLQIEFDHFHVSKLCAIQIQNNTWKKLYLDSIEMDKSKIELCETFDDKSMFIDPRADLKLHFKAHFIPEKFAGKTQIGLWFGKLCVRRTIAIKYQVRGPVIPKTDYDIPIAYSDLLESRYRVSRSEYMDALDQWVPSPQDDYAKHFHNLLYLEEWGLRKEIKTNYMQKEAFFGEQEYLMEDGKTIRKKYPPGVYDLEVKDLFEIRPSLQPGDKVLARKHSAVNVVYEGVLMALKDDNLVTIQFKDDFVGAFDNKAYVVDFDFSRAQYIRTHYAIDKAINMFKMSILNPIEIARREKPILDVHVTTKGKLKNGKKQLKWFNPLLNDTQKETVANILRGDILNPYVIYGPPGTGKTTTLTELILQILTNIGDSKIIVATQSNSASNLIAQRLISFNKVNTSSMVRLISRNYAARTNVIPEDIEEYVSTIDDLMDGTEVPYLKCLEKLKNYRIIIGTLSTMTHLLESNKLQNKFTHALIDEAGQCTEPSILVPMVVVGTTGQIVLAGDPMQMSPLCFNVDANERGLPVSMIKRLTDTYANIKIENVKTINGKEFSPIFKLLHNYRSLPSILNYYNTQFYGSTLVPMIDDKTSSDAKLLVHVSRIFSNKKSSSDYGIHFVDVNGKNVDRKHSWANIRESEVVEIIVELMMNEGMNPKDIGVIAPYVLQVRAIEHRLKKHPDVKVGTVEEFQGLERKIILISTTRTCPGGMKVDVTRHLGFVKCPKRINVAVSRARAMVVVVGKAELLSADENWKALIAGCKTNDTYYGVKL